MGEKMFVDQFAEFSSVVIRALPRGMDAEIAQGWITNQEALAKVLCEALVPVADSAPLLTPASTITVRLEQEFNPSARFVVSSKEAPTMFSYVGDSFKKEFIPPGRPSASKAGPERGPSRQFGKQRDATEVVLLYRTLNKSLVGNTIIAALGGETKAETTLAEVYALLSARAKGKKGLLLTNGYANIFYVRSVSGVLCLVRVYWKDGGWNMSAFLVEHLNVWLAGCQVFCRNL